MSKIKSEMDKIEREVQTAKDAVKHIETQQQESQRELASMERELDAILKKNPNATHH